MDDLKYWIALSRIPQLGAVRFRKLEAFFGRLEHAWKAGHSELRAAGLKEDTAQEVMAARSGISPDREMEALDRAAVRSINWHSEAYPPRLREIADAPPVLYYQGSLLPGDERAVAVVGTRNPTSYGREAAAMLSRDLAANGITVVSGLARGIDGIAHRTAIESGGRTIAVLAGGLDSVYPKEHAGLFRQVQGQGAVISEQPLGVRPGPNSFPRRNRLISGTTLGTVVVEAAEGSGARWTVYQALEQDREVFCVPGTIFSPASRFTNRMIQEGAKLVTSCDDILEELNLSSLDAATPVPPSAETPAPALTLDLTTALSNDQAPPAFGFPGAPEVGLAVGEEERALLGHLGDRPIHIDEICRQSGLPITSINSMLTMLELQGTVRQVGCMHYVRSLAGVGHDN